MVAHLRCQRQIFRASNPAMRPASATAISNAETYYAIRLEDRKGQPQADRAWQEKRSQLSSNHARRCVRALLKNELLKQALDPLLDVPGLRQGLMISTINKLLDARADEVFQPVSVPSACLV